MLVRVAQAAGAWVPDSQACCSQQPTEEFDACGLHASKTGVGTCTIYRSTNGVFEISNREREIMTRFTVAIVVISSRLFASACYLVDRCMLWSWINRENQPLQSHSRSSS